MEVFKTYLLFEDPDEDQPYLVDTIFHDGAWWLVASWSVLQATKARAPEKLIRLSGLHYEEVKGQRYRFRLHNPIPKSVFDGQAQDGYVIAMNQALKKAN